MQRRQLPNVPRTICRVSFRGRVIAASIFLVLVALFGLLWLTANEKIDMGWWLEPCGFKQRYDLPCPTCGMTTSVFAFVRGRIFESFYIQPAAALFCCVLVAAAFLAFLAAVFGLYFTFLRRFLSEVKTRHVIMWLVIIVAAGWAVTLAREISRG
ncbi:MAG: DUF2752 domain-containing protein [Planctomycetota bacterium]|jgi:hypothetical protein